MKRNGRIGKGRGRRNGSIWLLRLSLLLALAVPSAAEAAMRIGNIVPTVTLSSISGAPVRLPDSAKGKVVILHFWQMGCSSCKLEMPAMDELYGKYRQKGLEILAVNVGQKKELVQRFAAEMGVSYPILIDPDEQGSRLFGVTDVPRTYVIDRGGIIRYRIVGSATPQTLKKLILSLL